MKEKGVELRNSSYEGFNKFSDEKTFHNFKLFAKAKENLDKNKTHITRTSIEVPNINSLDIIEVLTDIEFQRVNNPNFKTVEILSQYKRENECFFIWKSVTNKVFMLDQREIIALKYCRYVPKDNTVFIIFKSINLKNQPEVNNIVRVNCQFISWKYETCILNNGEKICIFPFNQITLKAKLK